MTYTTTLGSSVVITSPTTSQVLSKSNPVSKKESKIIQPWDRNRKKATPSLGDLAGSLLASSIFLQPVMLSSSSTVAASIISHLASHTSPIRLAVPCKIPRTSLSHPHLSAQGVKTLKGSWCIKNYLSIIKPASGFGIEGSFQLANTRSRTNPHWYM